MVKTIIDENACSSPLGKISGHQRSNWDISLRDTTLRDAGSLIRFSEKSIFVAITSVIVEKCLG